MYPTPSPPSPGSGGIIGDADDYLYQEIVENALAATGARFVNLSAFDSRSHSISGVTWSVGPRHVLQAALDSARRVVPGFEPRLVRFSTNVNRHVWAVHEEGRTLVARFEDAASGTVPAAILKIPPAILGIRYTLSVPLLVNGDVKGSLAFHLPAPPAESVRRAGEAFARQAALTLENAQLSRALRERVNELQTLNSRLEQEIDQRVAAEQENARLAREAARAGALEELNRLQNEFISIASHELRTPMTTILGFSEILMGRAPERDPNRHFLRAIHEDSQRLAGLVDRLLDLSRIEAGRMAVEPVEVELEPLVLSLFGKVGPQHPRHSLMAAISTEAARVCADPSLLSQVLSNLLENAVKYTPDGGEVCISSRAVPNRDGWVQISVVDQGMGIPADALDRVFGRFQRVDTRDRRGIPGSGLGLYIVKKLVELHGGTVSVSSELGRGSTFQVILPARSREHLSAAAPL